VNHLDLIQSFIECCESRPPLSTLASSFRTTIEQLGFKYFACCSRVDPLAPPREAVLLHNYPGDWERVFSELKLHENDPVLLHAEQTLLPFFWDSPKFRESLTVPQKEILEHAARLGIAGGYTVPIHPPWALGAMSASCSVVPDSAPIDARVYFNIPMLAMYLYEAACRAQGLPLQADQRVLLSVRERQCLELVAEGKSDWAIGQILGIGESTAHTHIERAKRRLGVATRQQAVVRALVSRQISFCDVVRAEGQERAGRRQSRRLP
jgi:DNA-binding CsgD family transcriptional regulator